MTEPTERDLAIARAWITDDGRHPHFVARMSDADQIGALLAVAREEGRREERERWLECALVDACMEGPKLRGWNRSRLDRLWQESGE